MTLPISLRPWLALAGLAGALGAAAPAAAAAEFWVSPRGSEAGDGSPQAPWRTLRQARDFIRNTGLNRTMREDLIVNLIAGQYPVEEPIHFGPDDSGGNGHAIIYRSASGPGAACFVAATPVTGWTPDRGGVWKAAVAKGRIFRTLYENEQRGRIARTPNYAPDARYPGYLGGYLLSAGGAAGSITYKPGDLDPSRWSHPLGAEIWWWGNEGKRNWGIYPCPITAIDPSTRTIAFVHGGSPASAGERYFVQGDREMLDAPGEFFLDPAAGILYYYPMGGDPNARQILAPRVSEVFHLDGGAAGTHVHDLKFVGLAVRGTDYVPGQVVAVGSPRAAFFLDHTDHIEIRDCHLYQLGNLAVRILDDSDHDTVAGCWIERTGEGGIQVYNDLTQKENPGRRSEHHLITDCLIHDFSEVRVSTHWCGVQLFCVDESEVSHCVIFNSGRYAISLRGNYSTQSSEEWVAARFPSYGNRFAYLQLSHGGGDSGDMGLLHAAHCNPTGGPNINTWEQITISDVHAHPSMDDEPPDGIFLDHPHSCENQILRNIKVWDVQGLAFRTNHNPQQTLDNVSWMPGFNEKAMAYDQIGLTSDFPSAYRPAAAHAPSSSFFLRDGDRVCFYGDSITQQRFYGTDVETYVRTRFPSLRVEFIHSGVGGDRVTGGWAGGIDVRLQRDVFPFQPTVVTIMLGMNDGGYRAFDPKLADAYTAGYEHIIRSLQQHLPGVRIVLLEPSPYDDVTSPPKFPDGYNAVLRRYAADVRQLAAEHHLLCVDFSQPLVEVMQKAQAENPALAREVIPGRVHPSAAGSLVMAQALLRAWNAPPIVSAVTLDAADARVIRADNAAVSGLGRAGASIVWTQQDGSLPLPIMGLHEDWPQAVPIVRDYLFPSFLWPVPEPKWSHTNPVAEMIVRLSDFYRALDEEPLQVLHLPEGRYRLAIDGQAIGEFSAEQLHDGINLASRDTPMQAQAYQVLALVWKQTEWRYFAWRNIQLQLAFDDDGAVRQAAGSLLAALDDQKHAIVDQQYAAAQPQPEHFELTPLQK